VRRRAAQREAAVGRRLLRLMPPGATLDALDAGTARGVLERELEGMERMSTGTLQGWKGMAAEAAYRLRLGYEWTDLFGGPMAAEARRLEGVMRRRLRSTAHQLADEAAVAASAGAASASGRRGQWSVRQLVAIWATPPASRREQLVHDTVTVLATGAWRTNEALGLRSGSVTWRRDPEREGQEYGVVTHVPTKTMSRRRPKARTLTPALQASMERVVTIPARPEWPEDPAAALRRLQAVAGERGRLVQVSEEEVRDLVSAAALNPLVPLTAGERDEWLGTRWTLRGLRSLMHSWAPVTEGLDAAGTQLGHARRERRMRESRAGRDADSMDATDRAYTLKDGEILDAQVQAWGACCDAAVASGRQWLGAGRASGGGSAPALGAGPEAPEATPSRAGTRRRRERPEAGGERERGRRRTNKEGDATGDRPSSEGTWDFLQQGVGQDEWARTVEFNEAFFGDSEARSAGSRKRGSGRRSSE
jgi:hypothetical protein